MSPKPQRCYPRVFHKIARPPKLFAACDWWKAINCGTSYRDPSEAAVYVVPLGLLSFTSGTSHVPELPLGSIGLPPVVLTMWLQLGMHGENIHSQSACVERHMTKHSTYEKTFNQTEKHSTYMQKESNLTSKQLHMAKTIRPDSPISGRMILTNAG